MSIKVLVADDSITIQKVIGIIFGGDEYSLTVVDNGKAAVDKAREINPDILLIDALMPGMSGYEVAEMVRSTPALATKPILILTGSFEPFDEDKAKRCGADDFIAKPFESQQIITKVKELLELGSSRTVSTQAPPAPQPAPEAVRETAPPQPAPEVVPEPAPEIPVPAFESPVSAFEQTPAAAAQSNAPADIWGAFTPETEAPAETFEVPPAPAPPSSAALGPDVFAMVSEENDAALVSPVTPAVAQPQHTGTQWVPVEENTFEFEETIPEPPKAVFADQSAPDQKVSFGDISFEDDEAVPEQPVFPAASEPDIPTPAPAFAEAPAVAPVSASDIAPTAAPSPALNLTEEELRAAIIGASKEVIERIVWEVVPDLAEALIREAIRKIKEGV